MKIQNIKQAVILAGGRGTRLRPLTDSLPKPMAHVNGKPFLDYLINSIIYVDIKKILFLLGYKGEVIKSRYAKVNRFTFEFSIGSVEDKTGRRLFNAYEFLDDYFLLLYGDNYWTLELDSMLDLYNRTNAKVSTTVFSNKNGTGEYGFENNILVNPNGLVEKYDKKRKSKDTNGVDIGYFIVDKSAIDPNTSGNISFEEDILPEFIAKKQLAGYVSDIQYYFITNLNTLKNFESVAAKNNIQPLPNKFFK